LADSGCVTQDAETFFLTVVRYLSLHHAHDRKWTNEYAKLTRWLQEDSQSQESANRQVWRERSFRRLETRDFPVFILSRGHAHQGQIRGISAVDAKVRCTGLVRKLLHDGPMVLSYDPPRGDARIDLPVRVTEVGDDNSFRATFSGPPVVLHRRLNAATLRPRPGELIRSSEPTELTAQERLRNAQAIVAART
jgi:hypothetical protein